MSLSRIEKSIAKSGDMKKINAYSRRELTEDEVYIFNAVLCDNDVDRDYEKFSLSALKELSELFRGKTVICDHSMKSSDQKARIFDTFIEKQKGAKTSDGEDLYALIGRAYMLKNEDNAALIAELDAGIKKEGSVSCRMGRRTCSVCGVDKSAERCSHVPGRRYGKKLCFTLLENALDAYEYSFVAVPAQKKAGVTKSFISTKEVSMEDIINTIKSCDSAVELSKSQAEALSEYIGSLESDAALGKEYRAQLSKQVLGLMSKNMPKVEKGVLSSIVEVMTAKELMGIKKGLEEKADMPEAQLLPRAKENRNYSQFRI